MCQTLKIGRRLMFWAIVLIVGLLATSCSRSDEKEPHSETRIDKAIFFRLMREMPEARSFEFFDLDIAEQFFKEDEPREKRLPYGDIHELLNLPAKWEEELRVIFPKGSRGYFVKVWELPDFIADSDFYSVLQPRAWDVARFEALLKKNGFTNETKTPALWVGTGQRAGYKSVSIQLRLNPQRICVGNLSAADAVLSDRNFAQLPMVRELVRLMYPDACHINITTPSRGNSIFGKTHEGFAMTLRGNDKLDALLQLLRDEETAGRARSCYIRDSGSKISPTQHGRILIWETRERLSTKGGQQ